MSFFAWRTVFVAAFLVTCTLLFATADSILQAKIWIASWLPWADVVEAASGAAHADKWVHASLFAVLGLSGARAWHERSSRARLFFALALMVPLTEALQHWVPGRSASLHDALADLVGLCLGAVLGHRTARRPAVQRLA